MWNTSTDITSLTLAVYIFGLGCMLILLPGSVQASEMLEEIFAKAVALSPSAGSFLSLMTAFQPDWMATLNISSWNQSCLSLANNYSALKSCLPTHLQTCLSLKDLSDLYEIDLSANPTSLDVKHLSPALLFSALSCSSSQLNQMTQAHQNGKDKMPKAEEFWGYSFLFVTLINLCSLTGAIVLPCMRFKSYKLVLMFMVALAVGTLAGSGLLFLIPEAFMLVHDDNMDYIWKSTTVMGGIYLFYITEKVMRMINSRRENTQLKKRRDELATAGTITTSFRRIPVDNSLPEKDPTTIPEDYGNMICSPFSQSSSHSSNVEMADGGGKPEEANGVDDISVSVTGNGGGDSADSGSGKPVRNGHSHHHHGHLQEGEVAPVAYMIIFGDALHNFIDGLSIGSAFTQSIMTGISVSVAVMCEELPHELGDFAILLNSGMRFRKAIMYNFLSACTCYLGTIVGIILGENTASHEWIFAVAGGMFLYISLVDMMPEMNTAAESPEGKEFGEMKTFLLQNCGLLTGYGVMLIFAIYGGDIKFD